MVRHTFFNVSYLPCKIVSILNASIGAKTVVGRMAVHSITQAVYSPLRVPLGRCLVNHPGGDALDLKFDRVVANELFNALDVFLWSSYFSLRVKSGEDNTQPFVPWFDHSEAPDPGKVGMFLVWSQEPMQIPHSVLHKVRHVRFE